MVLSDRDRKILWAKAGNQCSYRYNENKCTQKMIEALNERYTVVGFECHIVGKAKDSARFLENYPSDKMDTYENRILLCGSHHKLLDDKYNEQIYTIEVVRKMKNNHELQVKNHLPSELMIQLKNKLLKCYKAFQTICNYYFQKNFPKKYYNEKVNQNEFIIALKLLDKLKDECLEYLAFSYEEEKPQIKYFGPTIINIIFNQLNIYIALNNSDGLNPIFMNINNETVKEKSEIEPIYKKLLNKIMF
ncbi:hypothetical protein LCGC14_2310700 [marine sediment metagenome]|uniref:Uncharacterized protein n=1 Tax=marine sediment metagenome TaxID=412755 RepID=A0A0F9CKR8_9ZZZZ